MTEKLLLFKKYLLEGYNIKESAKLSNIPYGSTYNYIKKYKLEVLNKNVKIKSNSFYFENIDTEYKAYILGFFIADGYIEKTSNRICFNNSIDDISIIEKIMKEISPDSKLYYSNKQNGAIFRKKQVILRFTNKTIAKTLIEKYNISNGKTFNENYIFDFDKIPENLQHHFIRGYFDGDGSVSFIPKSKDKQLFFNFSFVFNSETFANQIAHIFFNLFNIIPVKYNHIGKTSNYVSLRFNYNRKRQIKIKEVYNWLYKDATLFLERKKIKFEQYLNTELNT
jgi:hypothetical protein